jgi:hypothetical protein
LIPERSDQVIDNKEGGNTVQHSESAVDLSIAYVEQGRAVGNRMPSDANANNTPGREEDANTRALGHNSSQFSE